MCLSAPKKRGSPDDADRGKARAEAGPGPLALMRSVAGQPAGRRGNARAEEAGNEVVSPERRQLWREAMRKVERALREAREREERQLRSVEDFVAARMGWGQKETSNASK